MSNARELSELAGSYGTGGFVGMKNRIINGDFRVAQRGTSGTTTSSGYVSLDRWRTYISTASTITLSQQTFTAGQTDVPDNPEFFMRFDWLGTSPASTKIVMQRIENVKSIAGTVTLSFYAKTELGDNIDVEIYQNFGSGGSTEVTVLDQTIDITDSWSKYAVTFSLPSLSGKTIGSSSYIEVSFASRDTTANSYLDLAYVQLEKGSTATSFDYRPYTVEENLCKRYLPTWSGSGLYSMGVAANTVDAYIFLPFSVPPRVAPTGVTVSAGNAFIVSDVTSSFNTTSAVTFSQSSLSILAVKAVSAGQVANRPVTMQGNAAGSLLYGTGCEL